MEIADDVKKLVTKQFVCAKKCIGVVDESVGTQKDVL